jgi:hypothetical protein
MLMEFHLVLLEIVVRLYILWKKLDFGEKQAIETCKIQFHSPNIGTVEFELKFWQDYKIKHLQCVAYNYLDSSSITLDANALFAGFGESIQIISFVLTPSFQIIPPSLKVSTYEDRKRGRKGVMI